MTTLKKKPPTASIDMVALVPKSQKNEEQVFKKREPLKKKKVIAYWTKEEKVKKTFMKIIQQLYVVNLKK